MKNKIFFFILFFVSIFSYSNQQAFALDKEDCSIVIDPLEPTENDPITTIVKNTKKNDGTYNINVSPQNVTPPRGKFSTGGDLQFTLPGLPQGQYTITAYHHKANGSTLECSSHATFLINPTSGGNTPLACVAWINDSVTSGQTVVLEPGETAVLKAQGNAIDFGKKYTISISDDSSSYDNGISIFNAGFPQLNFTISTNRKDGAPFSTGTHVVSVLENNTVLCATQFAIGNLGAPVSISPTTIPPPAILPCLEGLDDNNKITTTKSLIKKCTKIDSAIGEIPTDPAEFVKKIFTVLLSMAGGWATYLIVVAGYKLMFSQGEAEAVKEAREEITSAIVGIVFMLLSLVILRVIGVDMFQLPTFN